MAAVVAPAATPHLLLGARAAQAPRPPSLRAVLTTPPPFPPRSPAPRSAAGKTRRAMGKRSLFHKLKDYKRALVQLQDDKTTIQAPAASAAQQQLR